MGRETHAEAFIESARGVDVGAAEDQEIKTVHSPCASDLEFGRNRIVEFLAHE